MFRTLAYTLVALTVWAALGPPAAAAAGDPLAQKIMRLTRDTQWKAVAAIAIPFKTFHPQGMVKINDDFYVSSVEVLQAPRKLSVARGGHDRDTGIGRGHLFKIGPDGTLLAHTLLGEGSIYHPGGIDFDGRSIWAPVSEYRPHSRAIVYKVDPVTMTATVALRVADHLGSVAFDRNLHQLHAVSWGSRQFYTWPAQSKRRFSKSQPSRSSNPNQYIDYQDCHYVRERKMLCSGLAAYAAAQGGARFELGGLDLVDLQSGRPVWQVPLELRSPSGRLMTQNPFFVEAAPSGLRAYFMPDDDHSTIFVFDAEPA